MQFIFTELIERFPEFLGTHKELILETFNKPNATDFVLNKYLSIKNFGNFYILIIFEMNDEIVRFSSAYRIHPKILDGFEVSKKRPIEILEASMNEFGITKLLAGFGEHKFFIDKKAKVFFPEILDLEKYLKALERL